MTLYFISLFLVFLLFYSFPIVEICGRSMLPTLHDGEVYLGRRVFFKRRCRVGCIYVLRTPYQSDEQRFVVKRLDHIEHGKYYFLGDNRSESYDSRSYGLVDPKFVVATLVKRLY